MTQAPIILFVYNRPEHTKKTIETLQLNHLASESNLYIFSDGYKNENDRIKVEIVRSYVKSISGFKSITIVERKKNLGLAESVITGVNEIINRYGKAIVLEDDLITSPYFLKYMNDALDLYENIDEVVSIHGYIYPVKKELPETFFLRGADCWGWATWKRGWDIFEYDGKKLLSILNEKILTHDFDLAGAVKNIRMLKKQIAGKNDSWAIRWHASAFIKEKLTLYPGKSFVNNIGADGEGTHVKATSVYDSEISAEKIELHPIEIKENDYAKIIIAEYFYSIKPGLKSKFLSLIKSIIS